MPRQIGGPASWLCLCCLSCQAAAGSDPSAAPPFEVEVTSVTVCETGASAQTAPAPKAPEGSGATLGVKVRLTGRYEGRIPANYFYASLLSRDGTRYLPAPEGCRPLLTGPPLLPGETREGYANFPLSAKKGAHRLAYAPNLEHTRGLDQLARNQLTVEVALP